MNKKLLGWYDLVCEVVDYDRSSDITTPLDLARKVVRTLPTSGKMLVPGSGIGTFAIAAILEGRNPNTITCIDYNKRYHALATRFFSEFGVKFIYGDYLTWDTSMKFDVIIGNPPYQAPKKGGKKGLGGDNSLFVKFIDKSLELVKDDGYVSMLTPLSALTKTTQNGKPTQTLKKMLDQGAVLSVDIDADNYFTVGTFISAWVFKNGGVQGKVEFRKDKQTKLLDVQDLYYVPPEFEEVEFNLFKKIMANRDGQPLYVTRNKPDRDYCMNRLGYPKIEKAGKGVLGFDACHAEFMLSPVGLWLLDYVRRHDQFIYHNLLTGIYIPENGFELTDDEQDFIHSREWRNFGVKESK